MVSQKGPNKSGAHLKKGVYSGKPRGIKKEEKRGAHLKKGVYKGKPRGRKLGVKNAL